MTIAHANNGSIDLAYEVEPDPGEPLLLIMGLGAQMISWPPGLVERLTTAGFSVARFDNRDSGLSTHLRDVHPPAAFAPIFRKRRVPYRLEDMAGDAAAVLDALGWSSAHIVGISLGAAIGQVLTAGRPDRVRSLTSISTAPLSLRHFRIPMKTSRFLAAEARRGAPTNRGEAEDRGWALYRLLNPLDPVTGEIETAVREVSGAQFDRSNDPDGARRQGAAIVASFNRTAMLKRIRCSTLVVHGDSDPLVPVQASRAAARAIPGARLIIFPGMGHGLPERVWPELVEAIARVAGLTVEKPASPG